MLSISAGSTGGTTATDVDDFLPRFAITQPFDILPNIINIPFGQFAIKAQHSAVLKKAVSVSADPFIVLMTRRVLNCQKKHLPRQARETNRPTYAPEISSYGHPSSSTSFGSGIIFLFRSTLSTSPNP